jgi:hypothetical protein
MKKTLMKLISVLGFDHGGDLDLYGSGSELGLFISKSVGFLAFTG